MKLLRLLPLFLLSGAVFAQQVTLRGKVEDLQGTSHWLVGCTDTELFSAGINLHIFVGQQVLVQGAMLAGSVPPHVDVNTIVSTPETFEIPGNPQTGGTMRFAATYTAGSQVAFYAALAPGFRPVGSAGMFFLDPATAQRVISGVIPALGTLQLSINVPNDATLIGRTVFAQALIRTGSVLILSNPDCKVIQ